MLYCLAREPSKDHLLYRENPTASLKNTIYLRVHQNLPNKNSGSQIYTYIILN